MIVSRKKFCEKTGLSLPRLCELLQKELAEAKAPNSNGIDFLHPCVEKYFNDPRRKNDKRRANVDLSALQGDDGSRREPSPPSSGEINQEGFPDLQKIQNMTLKEVAVNWRSIENFKEYLQSFKLLQDALKQEIGNAKEERKLVSRELCTTSVFSLLEQAHQRLLNDFPETITRTIYEMCKAGETVEKARGKVRDSVSDILGSTVRRVKTGLAGLNDGELDSAPGEELEGMRTSD